MSRPRRCGWPPRRRTPRATCCSRSCERASAWEACPTSTTQPWSRCSRGRRTAAPQSSRTLGTSGWASSSCWPRTASWPAWCPQASRTPAATGDTVAVTAVSADGTAVSLIQSLFHSFGSQVLEPGTGVILHNRGSMFSADPDFAQPPGAGQATGPHADAGGRRARRRPHLRARGDGWSRPASDPPAGAAAASSRGTTPQQAVAAPRLVVRDGAVLSEPGSSAAGLETLPVRALSNEVGHAMVCTLSPDGSLAAGLDPRSDGAGQRG